MFLTQKQCVWELVYHRDLLYEKPRSVNYVSVLSVHNEPIETIENKANLLSSLFSILLARTVITGILLDLHLNVIIYSLLKVKLTDIDLRHLLFFVMKSRFYCNNHACHNLAYSDPFLYIKIRYAFYLGQAQKCVGFFLDLNSPLLKSCTSCRHCRKNKHTIRTVKVNSKEVRVRCQDR